MNDKVISNAVPAEYEKFESGIYTGPPLEINTDVPDSIKDALVLYFRSSEAEAAKELGEDPSKYELRPLALHRQCCRRTALACLHFLAEAGDKIAKKMLESAGLG